MPRDLPIGNGSLLVNFDSQYRVRDIYYPHVGQENHTDGHVNHCGIWLGGQFAWLDDDAWQRDLRYEPETMVTAATLHHPVLNVTLRFTDAVDFDRPIFLRRISVTNHNSDLHEARLFFHYDWHIYEIDGANTVLYVPEERALGAYKGERYFLAGAQAGETTGISDWATGYKEFNNLQGTWRDAEDGLLSKNPIAQGSVDGTLGVNLGEIGPGMTVTGYHWLVAGKKFADVRALYQIVVDRTPESFIQRTRHYWRLWVNKQNEAIDLPQPLVDLYKRSLLIIATQSDNDGAIIAATDGDIWASSRDSYAYMWPRDGALVANALSHSGYGETTRAFFDFCRRVINREGFLQHKFTPAGAVGSSWHPWSDSSGHPQWPIQEDETALVVYSLWQHYSLFRDVEFIKPLYAPLIKNAADFMVEFRDPQTRLPQPSWDLWEERRGIHAYTIAAVFAGLRAAENFARIFGEMEHAARYASAAEEIRLATCEYLWRPELQRFVRRLEIADDGALTPDPVMDMAITALYQFGMLAADDPQVIQTMQALLDRLSVKTDVGGFARYENDYYHQVSHDLDQVAGNPWFICSCWAAQYLIARARTLDELSEALPHLQWVADRALPSGVLAEQVDPYTNAPLSASPLTWSHAEYTSTVRWYVGKARRLALETLPEDHPAVTAARSVACATESGSKLPGEPRIG